MINSLTVNINDIMKLGVSLTTEIGKQEHMRNIMKIVMETEPEEIKNKLRDYIYENKLFTVIVEDIEKVEE